MTGNNYIVVILCFLFSHGLFAQEYGYISGTVSDRLEPLGGTNINITDSPYGTSTNADGYFILQLDTGLHELNISLSGYQSETKIIEVLSLQEVTVDVELAYETMNGQITMSGRTHVESQLESSVPIDIFYSRDLVNTGKNSLSQALQYLVPSFYSVKQTSLEGGDYLDIGSLKGLDPNHVLVLVNGHRRHKSAYLHFGNTFARGSSGTDLNTIPLATIDRVEIRRDGASAEYGFDGIAGVINIVLKQKMIKPELTVSSGITQELDGQFEQISLSHGISLKNGGFASVSGSLLNQESINRSGQYTGPIFDDERDTHAESRSDFFKETPFDKHRIAEVGGSSHREAGVVFNAEINLNDNFELYGFGITSFVKSKSLGIYRLPHRSDLIEPSVHPRGFSPEIEGIIHDNSFVIGLRGALEDWSMDFSLNRGSNLYEISVFNSNNASLGKDTPVSAYAGGFGLSHSIFRFDLFRSFEFGSSHFDILTGASFREKTYEIFDGEVDSYALGEASLTSQEVKAAGIQGYSGISEMDRLKEYRSDISTYGELAYAWKDIIKLKTTARIESYSDFGEFFNFEFSGNIRLLKSTRLRGSYGKGFRLPDLQQLYFKRAFYEVVDGQLRRVVHQNTLGPISRSFGVDKLRPEESDIFNIGLTSKISKNTLLSIDYYQLHINDRLVLSNRISAQDAPVFESILTPAGIDQTKFFLNGIDSSTEGVDILFSSKIILSDLNLSISTMYSLFITTIKGNVKLPDQLKGSEDLVLGREDVSTFERYEPKDQWLNRINIGWKKLQLDLSVSRFGEVSFLHPDDGRTENWIVNEHTGQSESRDQVFKPKYITGVNLTIAYVRNIIFKMGVWNIFNVYPDEHNHSGNTLNGINKYNINARQFDLDGRSFFVKMNIRL